METTERSEDGEKLGNACTLDIQKAYVMCIEGGLGAQDCVLVTKATNRLKSDIDLQIQAAQVAAFLRKSVSGEVLKYLPAALAQLRQLQQDEINKRQSREAERIKEKDHD